MMAEGTTPPPKRFVTWIKFAVRALILWLVTWGVWRTVQNAQGEFARAGFAWHQLRPGWLVASMVFYFVGMLPSCSFWWNTLHAMGQQPRFWPLVRAFFIGHLGKYVPGKALVVVLRTGFVRGPGVDTTVAAVSVFVETLTLMAVGAVVAAVIFGTLHQDQTGFLLLSLFLAACAGVPTLPPLFRRAVRILQVHRANPEIDKAIDGLDARLMGLGWLTISLGWVAFGFSLWATMQAFPPHMARPTLMDMPLLTAAVALAMVAGFLSLLPGGIGVRELVVIPLLSPAFGQVGAIVAAVVLRVSWMATELIVAGTLYLLAPGDHKSGVAIHSLREDASLMTGGKKVV